MEGDSTVADALDRLRASGGRVTPQRRIVLEALSEAQPHPSADDIAALVAESAPEIHLSTVYRTLHSLADVGVITHVHLDHGRSVYHFSHDDDPHLVCRGCGAVVHLDASTFERVRTDVESATGFRLEHGHFAWSGRCPACRESAARST